MKHKNIKGLPKDNAFIVCGMYIDTDTGEYVVYSDDGIKGTKSKSKELKRFIDKNDALFFMHTHPLPISNFDKWIWDIPFAIEDLIEHL